MFQRLFETRQFRLHAVCRQKKGCAHERRVEVLQYAPYVLGAESRLRHPHTTGRQAVREQVTVADDRVICDGKKPAQPVLQAGN